MKKVSTAIAAIVLIGTPAFAADMPLKAPPPAPAPVYNWTGWYAGVNLGASFGHVKTDYSVDRVNVDSNLPGIGNFVATFGFGGTDISHPSGFIGGAQVGYNYQLSPIWVVGLEADFQGSLERETTKITTNNFSLTGAPSFPTVAVNGGFNIDYTTKIEWFGTVRGRVGYLWGDGAVLTYLTGGLAYAKVDLEGTSTVSGTGTGCLGCPLTFSATRPIGHSHVNTGWVVGYGMEGKTLIPGLTYKIESLYMDLGHLRDTDLTSLPQCAEIACRLGPAHGGQTITNSHFTDGILRLGFNYQFH